MKTTLKNTKIIVIANQKGGCGKTTISVHLACGILKLQPTSKVLIINTDLQRSANLWADNQEKFNFKILSSQDNLINLIEKENGHYDYLIIDTPPATDQSADSLVVYGALLVADLLIVPILCSALDLWATGNFETTIEEALKENPALKVYLLLNRYQARFKRTKRTVNLITETIPYPILTSKLAERNAFIDSADFGVTVYELNDQKAITEVNQLTKEIISILESKKDE